MSTSHAFAFVPDAWDTLRAEAVRAEQTVSVHPDVARWRAYRALDMVLATIEAYEGFPPQHRPIAERLTHQAFVAWLDQHPAPVKMWMHRIRQAGLVGAHVDAEWERSVEDARRVVETLHKLLWWLVSVYDAPPAPERPAIEWEPLLANEEPAPAPPSGRSSSGEQAGDEQAPGEQHADKGHPDEWHPDEPDPDEPGLEASSPAEALVDQTTARNAQPETDDMSRPSAKEVDALLDDATRAQIATLRSAAPHTPTAQTAALALLNHIHDRNNALLSRFDPDLR